MTRTSQGALKTFRFPKFWTVIAKALNKNCHERVRSITYSSCKIPSRFFWASSVGDFAMRLQEKTHRCDRITYTVSQWFLTGRYTHPLGVRSTRSFRDTRLV